MPVPTAPVSSRDMVRVNWGPVIERAAEIANALGAGTGAPPTLRQLFYRLVAEQLIENKRGHYSRLSDLTAQARREGDFPDLSDGTRGIRVPRSWVGPHAAIVGAVRTYRLDRTEGQEYTIVLGVEKRGMVEQLWTWFGVDLGVPVVAAAGYGSQTLIDQVDAYVARRKRPGVLLYAGDWDPSGEDILRDWTDRSYAFCHIERVALSADQVASYGLPEAFGKDKDSRAGRFVAKHGRLAQVELDALDPTDLQQLYADALDRYWDTSTYEAVMAREQAQDRELRRLVVELRDRDWDTSTNGDDDEDDDD